MKHSKNYMEAEPAYPPPVYAPEVVAEGILYCAQKPERDLIIGGAGKMFSAAEKYAPRVADKFQEKVQWRQLKKDQPTRGRDADILWGPSSSQGEMSERGDYEGHTMESSLYTKASMHPLITVASVLGGGPGGRGADRHRQPARSASPPGGRRRRPVPRRPGRGQAVVMMQVSHSRARATRAVERDACSRAKACFEYDCAGTAAFVLGHTRGRR